MKFALPDGSTLVDYPLLEHEIVSSLAERIVVDSGAIKIDSAHHNLDNAHLVWDGSLVQGQDYFKITKQGQVLVNVDYLGKVHCNADVGAPNITTIEAELASSTHLSTHDTLVKRDNNNTTTFAHITTNILNASQDVAMYGDCALTFTPQDSQGVNRVGYMYRFGSNTEEVGDFSGIGDGLEIAEPDVGQTLGNTLLIQTNDSTPTVEFRANKSAGVPWLLIRNSDDDEALMLDAAGCHLILNEKLPIFMTPGSALSLTTLEEGFQTHWFSLTAGWTGATSEQEIEIAGDTSSSDKENQCV